MKRGEVVVRWIAGACVAISIANIAIYLVMKGTERRPVQVIRFVLTLLLARALVAGRSWARWTWVLLLVLGGIGFLTLALRTGTTPLWFSVATGIFGATYLVSSALLVLSPVVREFFAAQRSSAT